MANKTNKEINVMIGHLFKQARENKNVTQNEMAESLGMGRNIIYMLESGSSKVSVEVLMGYCDKLGMTPNELLNIKENGVDPQLMSAIYGMSESDQGTLAEVLKLIYKEKKQDE